MYVIHKMQRSSRQWKGYAQEEARRSPHAGLPTATFVVFVSIQRWTRTVIPQSFKSPKITARRLTTGRRAQRSDRSGSGTFATVLRDNQEHRTVAGVTHLSRRWY